MVLGPEPPESTKHPLAPYLIEDLAEDYILDTNVCCEQGEGFQ